MKKVTIKLLLTTVFLYWLTFPFAYANENENNAILVTANRIELKEDETPFASELYNSSDIRKSGASTLYDFLDQFTSITVMPSYGNPYSQRLDMRGYGIGDGYQNMVITLNGQRLNNIDGVPQLLSAISINDIDRIEIIKGSGTVTSGDGAMAGVIHIYTRDKDGYKLGAEYGSHGQYAGDFFAGVISDQYSLNISGNRSHKDGFSEADVNGNKDQSDASTYRLQGKYYPTDKIELRFGKSLSDINTLYPGHLTLTEFNSNPAQNSGNTYSEQIFRDDNTTAGMSYDVNTTSKVELDVTSEKKYSEFVTYSSSSDYDYASYDLAYKTTIDKLKLVAGLQNFNGVRIGSTNNTRKINTGYFAQGIWKRDNTSYLAGYRTERIDYTYTPDAGSPLSDGHSLSSYELGMNHKYSASLSTFVNYQHAYQAPDIDRFFNFGGTFNAFIEPAISDTLNIGLTRLGQSGSKTKVALFFAGLTNEIYYNSGTFTNTNIDRSHKYGFEVQSRHKISRSLSTSIIYAYTKAIIDSEDDGGGAYDGKNLPGVSEHTLNLGLKYRMANKSSLHLTHSYRSEAYAANDFANSLTQKQPAYNSTNISYQRKFSDTTLYINIENLFDIANGIQINDDTIYPVNFTRTWMIGIKTRL